MNLIKCALLSVWHHKLQSLLLFLLAFAAAFQMYPSLSMLESLHVTEQSTWGKLGREVCVTPNVTREDGTGNYTAPLTASMLRQLAAIPYVKAYNPVTYRGGISGAFNDFNVSDSFAQMLNPMLQMQQPGTAYRFANVVIEGVRDSARLGEFTYGGYTLEGRHLTAADAGKPVALMCSTMAKRDHIGLGDTVTVSGCYPGQNAVKLTVVGIFTSNDSFLYNDLASHAPKDGTNPDYIQNNGTTDARDRIYAPYDLFDDAWWSGAWQKGSAQEAYFYLRKPSDELAFETAAKKITGMQTFQIQTHEPLYRHVVQPYSMSEPGILKSTITGFLVCMILFCLAVGFLVRMRRKELRPLLALGLSKAKAAGQLAAEVLLPLAAAFIVAAVVPGVSGSPLIQNDQQSITRNAGAVQTGEIGTMVSGFNWISLSKEIAIVGKYYPDSQMPVNSVADPMVTPRMLGEYAASGLVMVLLAAGVEGVYLRVLRPAQIINAR